MLEIIMEVKHLAIIMLALALTTVLHTVPSAAVTDSTVNTDFEGRSLVAMGKAMNSPLLRLLGRTFERLEQDFTSNTDNKTTLVLAEISQENRSLEQRLTSERKELIDVICKLHLCTDWTAWSDCTAREEETYGIQTRSRTCGNSGIPFCLSNEQKTEENDSSVCEGRCPKNYTLTKNGFCIGVHMDISSNASSAKVTCKHEGGFLLNIDSEVKAADVNPVLQQQSPTSYIWIDGTRTLPAGDWKYEYGVTNTSYINWQSNQPGTTADCKSYRLISGAWFWYGRPCGGNHNFVCEII